MTSVRPSGEIPTDIDVPSETTTEVFCGEAPNTSTAPIEIDGGIDLSNIARAVEAGVEIVVAGSAIFNTPDPTAATRALKDAAATVAS